MRDTESIVPSFMRELIKNPFAFTKEFKSIPFNKNDIQVLCELLIKKEKVIPNLVKLNDNFNDTFIIGDTHGSLEDTVKIIQPFLKEEVDSLLFLGDYVDRGPHSLINLGLILSLTLSWPKRVVILRGNHEDILINKKNGFKEELLSVFPSKTEYEKVEDFIDLIYNYLPLAAITPKNSIALHGGVPKGIYSIEDVNLVPKPHFNYFRINDLEIRKKAKSVFEQIGWNDPREDLTTEFASSLRDTNVFYFNEKTVDNFLAHSNAKRIIRAHESSRGGYDILFGGKLIHIFSTKPDSKREKVSMPHILHEQLNGKIVIKDLDFNVVKKIN